MKIVSEYKELAGQMFDTVQECNEAEAKVEIQRAKDAELAKKSSNRKRELVKGIDEADKAVDAAYENFEAVKKEVQKLVVDTNSKMTSMINTAASKIKEAEKARTDAILKYNAEFGSYQRVYSGDRAKAEYNRIEKQFANAFNDILSAFISF